MAPLDYLPQRVVVRTFGLRDRSKYIRTIFSWLLVAAAWIGLVSSLISIIGYASWVIDLSLSIYSFVEANAPKLIVLLDFVVAVMDWWRVITMPVSDFLFGWLPFDVPRGVIDVAVISSISLSGLVRAWFATSDERQFGKAISPHLSPEGRVALLKRIGVSIAAFERVDESSGSNMGAVLADKGERELVMALDELTDGARSKRRDDSVIDSIMDASRQDIQTMAQYMSDYEVFNRTRFRSILGRAIFISALLSLILVVDIGYRAFA